MADFGAQRAVQLGLGDSLVPPGHAQEQRCWHAAHAQAAVCGRTLPSAHLLDLHVEECHSALWAERGARGVKGVSAQHTVVWLSQSRGLTAPLQQYACFDPFCPDRFGSPAARADHLVATHLYPAAFFFQVVEEGIEGAQKRWGPAASLLAPNADVQLPAASRRMPAPSSALKRKQPESEDDDMELQLGLDRESQAAALSASTVPRPVDVRPVALHALDFVPRSVRQSHARLNESQAGADARA